MSDVGTICTLLLNFDIFFQESRVSGLLIEQIISQLYGSHLLFERHSMRKHGEDYSY